MSEIKHTPGPWHVKNVSDVFTSLGAVNSEGIPACRDDGWMISDCDMGSLCVDEAAANARLIAAAPELLEALKMVVRANNECIEGGFLNHNEAVQINEAIAKAEGGE